MLTYNKKKIKAVRSFSYPRGCSLGYNNSKKALVFFLRDSGRSMYTTYQLKKGSLVQIEKTAYIKHYYDSYPYYSCEYRINGKEVSADEYGSYSRRLKGKDISYKKIP